MKGKLAGYLASVRDLYAKHANEHGGSQFEFFLENPARRSALERVEKALGVELNPQLAQLWSLANGSDRNPIFSWGSQGCALFSIKEALEERSYFRTRAPQYDGTFESEEPRDPKVGEGWFSEGWLPFAGSEGGLVFLIDHQPLGTGRPGQVIAYEHDPDSMFFLADSLLELLPKTLADMESDPLEFLCIF